MLEVIVLVIATCVPVAQDSGPPLAHCSLRPIRPVHTTVAECVLAAKEAEAVIGTQQLLGNLPPEYTFEVTCVRSQVREA